MAAFIPFVGKPSSPWRSLVIGVIAAGLIGSGGLLLWRSRQTPLDLDRYTVPVQDSRDLVARIAATGKVVPVQTVNISPKRAGLLAELYVEQGDRVKAGQIIARMDNRDEQAQLAQAQANLADAIARRDRVVAGNRAEEIAQAEAQVRAAATRAQLAEERLKRNELLAAEGAIPRDTLDELKANRDSAIANLNEAQKRLQLLQRGSRTEEIRQAEAAVAAAQAQVQAARAALEDTVIRAPFTGIITQKYANPGAFVTPTTTASATTSATSTSIVAIAQGLEILAEVPEVDIGQVLVGQPVEIRADAYPGETFEGRVRLVAPEAVVEQNVTFFQVRVSLVTGLQKLRSGMNVDLDFLGQKINNALLVPTVAIAVERGQTGVYVVGEDNQPKFRPVTIGSSWQDQTQIISGLRAGERVFIDFPERLRPKQE
ncbi:MULTISPECIES: efflux RND transporter periplasmic adaptor subunit [unclassified Thermosynechococcus]|uniref:efflux RND transporter periplasmic adaptor subunit n=1 Tax=unclassified Thermosynechococcus TaxID=2622553 RepID=UPI0019826AA0|nr:MULTISPECIES: efflux RND transporter periplasmic adaptor subunit [unclassified Thermosynechococcus]MDR5639984.1 efflux RND transporter periplasmic adaptor subunit [Thermosynechococcus sp. PP42]QSF48901.1 efflux RND transporter periplasmic adaptor subunit [Thermosynechococcus sp. TA-1]WKT80900.1 efflux RND transporter periplasmic adaptor subunit [Thermosynechococcus sp. PP45]WNC24511.1 efflux RND transporter periplasmic adaptor subunit [Thermosynechococcus sp. PP551]WNC27089.1 efflux RND tra